MIWNVIDKRERRYRWQLVTAIVEPTWHDNSCADSDQAERTTNEIEYDEREATSIVDAIQWAHDLPFPVTLYIYELGRGTNTVFV